MLATRTLKYFILKYQTRMFFSMSFYDWQEWGLKKLRNTRMRMFGKRRKSILTVNLRSYQDGYSPLILMMQAWTPMMTMTNKCFQFLMMSEREQDKLENSIPIKIQYAKSQTMFLRLSAIHQACYHHDLKEIKRQLMLIMV